MAAPAGVVRLKRMTTGRSLFMMAYSRFVFVQYARTFTLSLGLLLAVLAAQSARAQCGVTVGRSTGGETGAVAVVNSSTLAVGRGNSVELFNTSNPNNPVPFSPRRTMTLEAPAKKIVIPAGSPRMFILQDNGDVCIGTIATSPLVSVGFPTYIRVGDAVDIEANGQIVYVVRSDDEDFFLDSSLDVYDLSSGSPVYRDSVDPLLNDYLFDRIVRIGNTVWLGMHEHESSIYGLEAFDVSNPANVTRVTAALNNVPLGTFTRVTAMHTIGNRILMSYRHPSGGFANEDWMRAVDVTNPQSIVWHPQVDLNGDALCMSSTSNLLRISIDRSGVGTWDTSNPASLTWLGAYFDSFLRTKQIVASGVTDYWAGGPGGLLTMNTLNPAAPTVRATNTEYPLGPTVVRTYGSTMVTLDYTLNTMYIYDITTPTAPVLRSSVFLPLWSEKIEIGTLSGGAQVLACVATSTLGNGITVYDITNPAAPFVRGTIPSAYPSLLSVNGSRLYMMNYSSDLKIYELSSNPPALRSTTPFGGAWYDYTCMTSWDTGSVKAVALGTHPFGLWIINTTSATAPLVSSIWNPTTNYRVSAVTKGPNFLYVSAWIEGTQPNSITDTRLESLNVNNLASVTQRWVTKTGSGIGAQGRFEALSYIAGPSGKFLVGTRYGFGGEIDSSITLFELPPGFFTGEGVPFLISRHTLPYVQGPAAPSGTGSHVFMAGKTAGVYQLNTPTQWAPGFGLIPFTQTVCNFGTAQFTGLANAVPSTITYQWTRYGPVDPRVPGSPYSTVTLTDGPTGWGSTISGSTSTTLAIANARHFDTGYSYRLTATNSCGSTSAFSVLLQMCVADFNCSGTATVQDIFDYLNAWFAAAPSADLNADGLTIQDLFDFLNEWFGGCL